MMNFGLEGADVVHKAFVLYHKTKVFFANIA